MYFFISYSETAPGTSKILLKYASAVQVAPNRLVVPLVFDSGTIT